MINNAHLRTPEFFKRLKHYGADEDIWSANQGTVPRSSHMVEILLSGTYWKVVHSLEVTDTDCDKPHIGTQALGVNTEWNQECRINGEKCHLPISLLTTYFTLDCSSQYYLGEKKTVIAEILCHILYLNS